MAHLSIRLLGPFDVRLDDRLVSGFVSDKVRALLAYLVTQSDRAFRRETLAGLLWPDVPETSARNSLRTALVNLRTRSPSASRISTVTSPSTSPANP